VTGLALYNKHLIVLLLFSVAVGLLWLGPRSALRSRWLWAGVGLAVLVGSPNLIYQTAHGFPQLDMAAALAENKGGETRLQLLPFQLLLLGPPVTAIWVAGLVALFRRPAWRPARALAGAYPVLLVIVLISGGQVYYPVGLLGFLFAAGCVPTVDWVARRPGPRRALVVAGLALNTAVTLVLALPLLPIDVLGDTPIPAINQGTRDQIGWPAYTREVAAVYAALPESDRGKAVILTGNYGEAGALDRERPGVRSAAAGLQWTKSAVRVRAATRDGERGRSGWATAALPAGPVRQLHRGGRTRQRRGRRQRGAGTHHRGLPRPGRRLGGRLATLAALRLNPVRRAGSESPPGGSELSGRSPHSFAAGRAACACRKPRPPWSGWFDATEDDRVCVIARTCYHSPPTTQRMVPYRASSARDASQVTFSRSPTRGVVGLAAVATLAAMSSAATVAPARRVRCSRTGSSASRSTARAIPSRCRSLSVR